MVMLVERELWCIVLITVDRVRELDSANTP
jgi:hypothetical protein